MPVKSNIDFTKPLAKGRTYPYMGVVSSEQGDLIVLFAARGLGTVLKETKISHTIGTQVANWTESEFAVLQNPLVMENE